MRSILTACALAVACSRAFAADAPTTGEVDWSGFYVGGQFGATQGDVDYTTDIFFNIDAVPGRTYLFSDDDNYDLFGLSGGLYAGFNFQSGPVVFGIDAIFSASAIDGQFTDSFGTDFDREIDWLAYGRGRIGYAFDQVLFYVAGGVAAADTNIVNTPLAGVPDSDSATHYGWTVGAGAEVKFSENVSARFEYLYTDLGSENYSFDYGLYESESEVDIKLHSFLVGVAYHF